MSRSSDYDYLFKMILVGASGVGKSSILNRYADDTFSEFVSTIGVDFKVCRLKVDDKVVKLQIWDTAGQERFRTITPSYYRGAESVILVYDVTDERSFEQLPEWIAEVERIHGVNSSCLKLLVGNKDDLIKEKIVSTEKASKFAESMGIPFIETSAKTNTNIDKPFYELTHKMLERVVREQILDHHKQDKPLGFEPKKEDSCC